MDLWAWMERLARTTTALEPLLAHYEGMLRYIISGMLSDPQDQEDCLAQVRARLWEGRHQYDREKSGAPATWLTATLPQHRLRPPPRPAPPRISEELDPAAPTRLPDRRSRCFKKGGSSVCRRHWTSCPAWDRALFYRKYYYLQSTARIAAELGTTERAVEGKLTASANVCKPC